jgi:hypothetical protein
MPVFRDYHRTVVGYHGTLRSTALAIVAGERGFRPSQNDDDWLGHGVYFWEYAPQQAWVWAQRRYGRQRKPIAVLGAMIRLGSCLDLLDPNNAARLVTIHEQMLRAYREAGQRAPSNYNAKKYLDCATFQYAYAALEADGQPIDTCRAVYVPTDDKAWLWERSWLYHQTHIQLCVHNLDCILGCWLVKPEYSDREA